MNRRNTFNVPRDIGELRKYIPQFHEKFVIPTKQYFIFKLLRLQEWYYTFEQGKIEAYADKDYKLYDIHNKNIKVLLNVAQEMVHDLVNLLHVYAPIHMVMSELAYREINNKYYTTGGINKDFLFTHFINGFHYKFVNYLDNLEKSKRIYYNISQSNDSQAMYEECLKYIEFTDDDMDKLTKDMIDFNAPSGGKYSELKHNVTQKNAYYAELLSDCVCDFNSELNSIRDLNPTRNDDLPNRILDLNIIAKFFEYMNPFVIITSIFNYMVKKRPVEYAAYLLFLYMELPMDVPYDYEGYEFNIVAENDHREKRGMMGFLLTKNHIIMNKRFGKTNKNAVEYHNFLKECKRYIIQLKTYVLNNFGNRSNRILEEVLRYFYVLQEVQFDKKITNVNMFENFDKKTQDRMMRHIDNFIRANLRRGRRRSHPDTINFVDGLLRYEVGKLERRERRNRK